jgi:hypothetical protein
VGFRKAVLPPALEDGMKVVGQQKQSPMRS